MILGLPNDYQLTAGEINNIVYITCKSTVGWPMRSADLAICQMMRDSNLRGDESVTNLVEVTCEYVWDHICGESSEFTAEDLVKHMEPGLVDWFQKTTQEERSDTGEEAA